MKNIPLTPVESSQIVAIGHESASNTLRIQFKTKKTDAPPSLYDYANFTEDDYLAFLKAESKGRHFGQNIKGNPKFPHTKLATA